MKVYVIRHGESATNLANRWTGWLDVHLRKYGYTNTAQRQRKSF